MAHPNEAVVLRFLEALPKRDLETIEELLADDVVWHWAGRGPLSGEYRGKDRFSEFSASLGRMIGEPGAKHRVELHDIVANDEHTIVLWTRIAERGAATIESHGGACTTSSTGRSRRSGWSTETSTPPTSSSHDADGLLAVGGGRRSMSPAVRR